ncbi:aquaporin-11 [Scyliorhinus canicula]|uniref:aquaporin-11 n=1 Tax=Scyliorhinus canicula TaxID=7830 RepID=UPI0018F44EFF|nr:aquaporin-11 [Scyliorhinus canicula]
MEDVLVSVGVLAGVVTVCQLLRRTTWELLCPRRRSGGRQSCLGPEALPLEVIGEFVSTLQLCVCTHELQLLGSSGMVGWIPGLGFTYLMTVVHITTFSGASCNPMSCLEQFLCGQSSGHVAASKLLAQFGAASVARQLSEIVWAMDLSDLHWHHRLRQYKCTSALNTTPGKGLVTEFFCAFTLRAALFKFQFLKQKHKIHAVAVLITCLVFAGGDLTGAVFNPALAYSITFNCVGSTYLEYCFVYWLGPLLGVMTAVLMFGNKSVLCANENTKIQTAKEKRA